MAGTRLTVPRTHLSACRGVRGVRLECVCVIQRTKAPGQKVWAGSKSYFRILTWQLLAAALRVGEPFSFVDWPPIFI